MKRVKAAVSNTKFWLAAAAVSAVLALTSTIFVIYTNVHIPQTRSAASISNRELILSETSKEELRQIVIKEDVIVAATAVNVSLPKNTRTTTFFYSDLPQFAAIYDAYVARKNSTVPTFTNEVGLNNRITTIINGNFDCREFKNTIAMKYYPEAEPLGPWMCTIAVPTGFDPSGDFVGFMVFYLATEPSTQEQKRLGKIAVEASTRFYRRDIVTQRRE